MDSLYSIITSPVTNTLLAFATLLEGFLIYHQSYKQQAKEDSVGNSLLALRMMLSRLQGSLDAVDALDGTLATLGIREKFTLALQGYVIAIKQKFHAESEKEIDRLPNEHEVV
jgi:hypothetical protein